MVADPHKNDPHLCKLVHQHQMCVAFQKTRMTNGNIKILPSKKSFRQHDGEPEVVGDSVGHGDTVGSGVGLALSVGMGDMVGAKE